MSSDDEAAQPHLVSLPGRRWSLWRWVCVRGAGFPASLAIAPASNDAADAADAVLEAELARGRAANAVFEALRDAERAAPADAHASVRRTRKQLARGRIPGEADVPAGAIDALAALRAAAAREAEAREAYERAFAAARAFTFTELRRLAADARFREAVTWQNRAAVITALDALARSAAATNASDRRHEELVASYLHRYSVKNDTIGFFGPVGWASVAPSRPTEIVASEPFVTSRAVHFEHWPVDALAEKLGADPRYEPWMVPRKLPFVRVEGATASSPVTGQQSLAREELEVLAACDGARTATDVAKLVRSGGALPDDSAVLAVLRRLREKKIIAWAFEVPVTADADRTYEALVARVGDDTLRDEAMQPIRALDSARREVASAAGDPDRLARALDALETNFTQATGVPAQRHAGSMYAARTIVYEDCRRHVDATIGGDVLGALAAPLDLLVTSARWFTHEVGRLLRDRLFAIYADATARRGTSRVPFTELWQRGQALLVGSSQRVYDGVSAELRRRWASLLALENDHEKRVHRDSQKLAAGAGQLFAAPRPGWRAAAYHSPDVMIAAPSLDAIRRQEFELVFGEFHVAMNTLDTAALVAQHPRPDDLADAFARDMPEPLVLPVYAKDWLRVTARTGRAFAAPSHFFLETAFDPAPAPRDRALAIADVDVELRDGELVACTPSGGVIDALELFGDALSSRVGGEFGLLPPRPHCPRVTIDRVVVARESWTVAPSEIGFADVASEDARFLNARRWAAGLGLPRWVFAKSAIEVKPIFVDLNSALGVNVLAKLARRARERPDAETPITLSEMLPDPEHAWLPDAAGGRYTCELRFVVLDRGGS